MGDYELQTSPATPAPYVLGSYATFAANGTCGTAPFPTLAAQFSPAEIDVEDAPSADLLEEIVVADPLDVRGYAFHGSNLCSSEDQCR